MNRFGFRSYVLAAALGLTAVAGAAGQEAAQVELGPMMRLNSGPEGSFAFTTMVRIRQPANSQMTIRLVKIEQGKTSPAYTSTFTWRGAAEAGPSAAGQVLLFGQSGDEIGKAGRHYLSLMAGFEGNPAQRSGGSGPLNVENAGRWWTRYGSDADVAAGGDAAVLYAMGSGEAAEFKTLADLEAKSRREKETIVALTLEIQPTR